MKKLFLTLFFVSTLFITTFVHAASWVAFSSLSMGSGGTFLMQIDTDGTILVPPTPIVGFPKAFFALNALSDGGPGQLFLWGFGQDSNTSNNELIIDRINISTDNFSTSALKRFPITPSGGQDEFFSLAATQNVPNKLLVFQKSTNLKAFGIASNGAFDGRKFRISPRTSGSFINGGISADGRMAWSNASFDTGDKLYLQPLRADGLPTGTPKVAASTAKDQVIFAGDLSNLLANGNRLAAYVNIPNNNTSAPATIYTQLVNGTTGGKVATRQVLDTIPVNSLAIESLLFNPIAIDPEGKFILYITIGDCSGSPVTPVVFQALDATGAASGSPILLTDCDFFSSTQTFIVFGLDTLRVQ